MSSLRELMRREKDSRKLQVDNEPTKVSKTSHPSTPKASETIKPPILNVIKEEYELLDSESVESEASTPPKILKKNESQQLYQNIEKPIQEQLVYESLNTAICSGIDYEREKVAGFCGDYPKADDCTLLLDDDENDELYEGHMNPYAPNSTITSNNFGKNAINVGKFEKLPQGFFDDTNLDAKASGRLNQKQAIEKLKQLDKKKSIFLKEVKYIKDKYIEAHREQIRYENDQLDHEEAVSQYKSRLFQIKNQLNTNKSSQSYEKKSNEPTMTNEIINDESLKDLDDWKSRSLT